MNKIINRVSNTDSVLFSLYMMLVKKFKIIENIKFERKKKTKRELDICYGRRECCNLFKVKCGKYYMYQSKKLKFGYSKVRLPKRYCYYISSYAYIRIHT